MNYLTSAIQSINNATSSAQTIVGGTGISVSTVGGSSNSTTTLSNTGVTSLNAATVHYYDYYRRWFDHDFDIAGGTITIQLAHKYEAELNFNRDSRDARVTAHGQW